MTKTHNNWVPVKLSINILQRQYFHGSLENGGMGSRWNPVAVDFEEWVHDGGMANIFMAQNGGMANIFVARDGGMDEWEIFSFVV